jgi:uncharacterized protein
MKRTSFLVAAAVFLSLESVWAQSDYGKKIEQWRKDEEADLKKDNGWLTLAGLFWLKDGTNSVGTGPDFDVRLTKSFKGGKFGQIDFQNGTATLKVEKGVEAQSSGKDVETVALASDDKGKPTEIKTGSQTFSLIERQGRYGIRLKDNQSKTRLAFKGQQWFPVDESYKVTARLEAYPEPKELLVPNVLGQHLKEKSPGLLKFTLKGKECSLQPILEENGSLFLIFRDASNDKTSYSAGRFLHADKPVGGETPLDFNQAENPPCAFTHLLPVHCHRPEMSCLSR